MSASAADLDGAIARLNKVMSGLEARVRDLRAKADSVPSRGGDDDLFAGGGSDSAKGSEREAALEAAAAEASAALDKAAAEIRAVLEGA